MPDSTVRQGYLVLADISGYTAFLTGNELEHAHGIIEDLTSCVVGQFSAPWRLVKLEGDAVFVLGPAAAFEDAERVIEAIERCYCAFSDLREDIARSTTCECSACANIATLNLKFLAHFGSFVPQRTAGIEDVAGPDVILVHRLLKNTVPTATGIQAYAFVTDALRARVTSPALLIPHSEEVDGFGEVGGAVEDLAIVHRERTAARHVYVSEADADFSFSYTVAAPAETLWQYWTEATKRLRWSGDPTQDTGYNERGRTGVGSSYHCAHGRGLSLSRYVDWQPFRYFSTEKSVEKFSLTTPPNMFDTCEFEPLGDSSTRVTYRFRVKDRGFLSRARVRAFKPMLNKLFARDRDRLTGAVAEDRRLQVVDDTHSGVSIAAPISR